MIAFRVNHQAVVSGKEQRGFIEPAYLAPREAELKGHVMLARHVLLTIFMSQFAGMTMRWLR
jgi:signal transduction histidine kinase